jgi:hypothetical protein
VMSSGGGPRASGGPGSGRAVGSRDGSAGTGSPVITERRNSMIFGTCARPVAGVPNRTYPRDLLADTHPMVRWHRTVIGLRAPQP